MKIKPAHLIIIGLVVYIILMSTCNSKPVETKETKVYRADSIYVYITDTIESVVSVPSAPVEIHDTIYKYGNVHNYVYWKHDSLLDAKIEVDAECYPKEVRFSYDVKQFTIRDTIQTYIRDSVHTKEIKSYLSLGAMVGGSRESFLFAPTLSYEHKNGMSYRAGYDIIGGNYMLGFSKKIRLKK